MANDPWTTAAAFLALYVTVAAASIPGAAVLTLAAGALFGVPRGLVLVSFASTVGASLAFLLARFVLRDALRARYRERLARVDAGSAGLVSALIASTVKARVALIEKDRMGGDCLNTGCVPSKALLRTARLLADARDSRRFGVRGMTVDFDFADAMERVQQIVRAIEPHDSVERYRGLGVDVVLGEARLVSPWEVEVAGRRLTARSIVLATGARPLVPPLPGLDAVEYLTSDTIWSLRTLPKRLVVLGGGPIGCELAQAFARFGSAVTVVEMAARRLPREDAEAGSLVAAQFRAEGIEVAVGHRALRVEPGRLVCERVGERSEVSCAFDALLVALGREARVEGYGLDALGIRLTDRGTIEADGLLRTTVPNVLVCGDATGPFQFTHVAAHQAWFATVNALLAPFWSFPVDYRVIPWATFTEPEVARVGLSEDEARERKLDVEVTRYPLSELDRAVADGADEGFVKVLTPPGKDTILGATVVGAHAADVLAELVLAMKHGLGLNEVLGTIHVYPTMAEANRFAAGAWKRAHAPQGALRWAERFFAWRRG